MNLSEFFEPMRIILGDSKSCAGIYQYSDEQLTSGVRTLIMTGLAPEGISLTGIPANTITPAPTPDQFGYLVIKSALLLVAGCEIFSYRTTELSVTRFTEDKRIRINHLMDLLETIEEKGNLGADTGVDSMFASSEECLTRIETHCADCA